MVVARITMFGSGKMGPTGRVETVLGKSRDPGVDILSVTPRMYLRVKQIVRALNQEDMKGAVSKAIKMSDSDTIRKLFSDSQ